MRIEDRLFDRMGEVRNGDQKVRKYLGPILCEIENADRKRKTAFFDLEFFDQKNKAILCARILAISVQHFSI